jgi:hypothetical protein
MYLAEPLLGSRTIRSGFRVRRYSGPTRQGDRADRHLRERPCDQGSAYRAPDDGLGGGGENACFTTTIDPLVQEALYALKGVILQLSPVVSAASNQKNRCTNSVSAAEN